MRNGEAKYYKGYQISKVSGSAWLVGGFGTTFRSYDAAKDAVDAAAAQEKALADSEQYVRDVCGGYM